MNTRHLKMWKVIENGLIMSGVLQTVWRSVYLASSSIVNKKQVLLIRSVNRGDNNDNKLVTAGYMPIAHFDHYWTLKIHNS